MASDNSGKAKGGNARAEKLSPERRKEIALQAVETRKRRASMPKASHRGEIKIGDMVIPCCVLEDGRRLLSEGAITGILGTSGGKSYRLRDATTDEGIGPMPLFISSKALQPFIGKAFEGMDLVPRS